MASAIARTGAKNGFPITMAPTQPRIISSNATAHATPKDFSFPVSESARRILSSHSTSLLVLFLPLARIALSRRLFFLSRIAETSAPMLSGVSPRMRTMPKAISRKLII